MIEKWTLGELRQLEALGQSVKKLAAKEINREADAVYLFEALDEIPENWPSDKLGDGCHDVYCPKCARKTLKIGKKFLPKDYNGAIGDSGEGEHSRNCFMCGCPLPWSLLKYGMESEIEHYESELFFERFDKGECSENDWYWLWKVVEECLGCESYLNDYGHDVRRILIDLFIKSPKDRERTKKRE